MRKKKCFRIVTDDFAGYEVQIKKRFLFFIWWDQLGFTNTHNSIERAKDFIEKYSNGKKEKEQEVVWMSDSCW
jgi:hypothetical protein